MFHRLKITVILLLSCCVLPCAHGSGLDDSRVQQRLSTLENHIPLPYHPTLPSIIQSYASKQLPASFSVYESVVQETLREQGLPEELVYLPVAMTNMKIDYRHGARAGVWALPELVALRYGLMVDDTHDERFSVEAASKAAIRYLHDLYADYGDWWQCILAYTNSPAAINGFRIRYPYIDPSNPWSYVEHPGFDNTAVVGNYIASYYVYSSDDKSVAHSTERYHDGFFDRPITWSVLSSTLGIAEKTIRSLNPIFLTDPIIPFNGHTLRLPADVGKAFEDNKELIYSKSLKVVEDRENQARIAAETKAKAQEQARAKRDSEVVYTVKRGDTLGKIAQKYHVKISDIKKWNKLKGDMIRENQKLKIHP